MDEIAGDQASAQWKSSRKASAGGGTRKNDWLAESIAKADAMKAKAGKKSVASKPSSGTAQTPGAASGIKKKSRTARSAVKL
jgi:hypothetical protein